MDRTQTSLEPLADYLEPQFGNIYDYNFVATGGGLEVQLWTDELRRAVKQYLLHEASTELVAAAFPHKESMSRDLWAEDVLSTHEPWEVAYAFYLAAVRAVSTLDALIGHLQTWSSGGGGDERMDAANWLQEHATESQLERMAIQQGHFGNLDVDLERIDPPDLLHAWHEVSDSAPSDLTDTEWQLIAPFIPARADLGKMRRAVDGILYCFAEDVPWSRVPERYGNWQNIYQRYRNYKRSGVFARTLEALQTEPEAARLVEWLLRHAYREEGVPRHR